MAKDRFASTNMRQRVMREERTSTASAQAAARGVAAQKRRAKRPTLPKQSVAEFLAGGGEITKVPGGAATEDAGSLLRRIPGTKNGFVRTKR
jgi:hypothetical protein